MSNTISNIQKLYFLVETLFGDATADFTGGVQLQPTEIVKTDGLTEKLLADLVVRASRSTVPDVKRGPKEGKISVPFVFSPATKTAGTPDSDGLTTILELMTGSVVTVSDGTVDAAATTTHIPYSSGTFADGNLVKINGETRMVTGDTGSAFDVTIPLTTAPTAGDDIDGTQYFPPATGSTFGVGVHGDDTELNRLLKGTTCMELKLSAFKSREVMVLTAELECATWAGNQTFTAPSTIAPSDPAICDDGPGLQLTDSTDALWSPCEGEVTCNLGVSKKWKLSAGGVGGYCGVVDVLGDGTVEATLYQDGTLSKLEALLESSGPIVLQAGEDDGTVVGVYVPDATISVYPTPDNIDTVNTIKVSWMSAQGILYRA